jgi:hypothetical protein
MSEKSNHQVDLSQIPDDFDAPAGNPYPEPYPVPVGFPGSFDAHQRALNATPPPPNPVQVCEYLVALWDRSPELFTGPLRILVDDAKAALADLPF